MDDDGDDNGNSNCYHHRYFNKILRSYKAYPHFISRCGYAFLRFHKIMS